MSNKVIFCYTDGSAVVNGKNKGKGGFGTYFPELFGQTRAFSLAYKDTKTGRMEITALYYAIKAMPLIHSESVILRVYSDSEYVVKSFTENRLNKWIKAGWKNTSGDVKNDDLWKALLKALNKRKYLILDMHHIKSHQVEKEKDPVRKKQLLRYPHIKGNYIADKLANYKRHTIFKESDLLT